MRRIATAPLGELPLAPHAARRAAELAHGTAAADVDTCSGVMTHVLRIAAASPDREAVADSATILSYAELAVAAQRLHGLLAAAGCRPGEVVATACSRTGRTVAVFLALEDAGAVYLPLDPGWPAERLADTLAASGAGLLLACEDGEGCGCGPVARVAGGAGVPVVGVPSLEALRALAATAHPTAGPAGPGGADRAGEARYALFTSGSTGRPKGAVVEHRGMMNHLWVMVRRLALTERDRVAFTAPPSYVISIWQMLAPLLVGGTVAVLRDADCYPPRRFAHQLQAAEVTILEQVPAVVDWLVTEASRARHPILTKVRWLISTGQELLPALAVRVLAELPHARLLNAYGATECSDDVTHHEVTGEATRHPRLPLGDPIPGARLYVLVDDGDGDGEGGGEGGGGAGGWRAAEDGEVGELFVGGSVVGAGYVLTRSGSTSAFYRDAIDATSPTGRLYRTGDLVVRSGDGLFYQGRGDRQIKLSGVRMELDDIESAVRRLPEVRECAVVVGQVADRPVLVAYYTAAKRLDEREQKSHLASWLPAAMVPRALVQLPALPLNANGKTDYPTLRDMARPPRESRENDKEGIRGKDHGEA